MKHLPTYTDLEVVAVEYLRGSGLGVVHRPQLDVDTIRAPDGTPCAFPFVGRLVLVVAGA